MTKLTFLTTPSNSKSYDYTEHTWVLDNQLKLNDVLKLPQFSKFKKCATIQLNNNSAAGYKINVIPEYSDKKFMLYLLVYTDPNTNEKYILKGGKSKNELKNRSYSAGTEESWTMRGTPTVTNYVWSQQFRKYGNNFEFYGYAVPTIKHTYESFDGEMVTEIVGGHYETEEVKLNNLLKKLKGSNLIGEGALMNTHKE